MEIIKRFQQFFQKRNHLIHTNIEKADTHRIAYLKQMDMSRRLIAVVISLLYFLKLEIERGLYNTEQHVMWTNIKTKIENIEQRVVSHVYCVYRSQARSNINTQLVEIVSPKAVCAEIKIHDCKTTFMIQNKIVYGKVIKNHIVLHVYEDTTIRFPKDLVQLHGDSITIEYVDVFSSRGSRVYKYKGLDARKNCQMEKIAKS